MAKANPATPDETPAKGKTLDPNPVKADSPPTEPPAVPKGAKGKFISTNGYGGHVFKR